MAKTKTEMLPDLDKSNKKPHMVSPTASLEGASLRYNLRSHGPPRYVQFADEECPICLEEYSLPVIANCGHSFCRDCLKKCIVTAEVAACPLCKERLIKRLFINSYDYTKQISSQKVTTRNSMTDTTEYNRQTDDRTNDQSGNRQRRSF